MTAPTDLLDRGREITRDLGALPSQNQLKTALKVGAPKAREVREALEREAAEQRRARRPRKLRTGRRPVRVHVAAHLPTRLEVGPTDAIESGEPATVPEPTSQVSAAVVPPGPTTVAEPVAESMPGTRARKHVATWPILVLALPAFVAIWAGWVGIGGLTGFGEVNLLPGIAPAGGWATLNTAITLPIGMETYAAYALRVWLSNAAVSDRARMFARNSAIGALLLGAGGQVAYHVMTAYGIASAPWWITTAVSCIPVGVLGMGAALRHLTHSDQA